MPDVAPRVTRTGQIEGSIDRADDRTLQLWCRDVSAPTQAMIVDILINDALFGRFVANEYRPDLEAAGKGGGLHGLTVDLSGSPLGSVDGPLVITACLADMPGHPFAMMELRPMVADNAHLSPTLVEHLLGQFPRLVDDLHGRSRMGWGACETPALDRRAAAPMVAPAASKRLGAQKGAISKYAEYTRQRMNVQGRFEVDQSSVETDNFLKWYLESYVRVRAGARAPISAPELAYLNELMIYGGQQYHLSRITWMFLLDEPGLLGRLNLNSPDSYIEIVYWWSVQRSRDLWCDDCLVHPNYVQALGEVSNRWRSVEYPLSRFMELTFNRRVEWHFLNLEHEQDRCIYYALLLLDAARQPSFLQYVPRLWLQRMLRPRSGGGSMLETLVRQVVPAGPALNSVATYHEAIKAVGFDLARGKPTSLTVEGHRASNFGLRPEVAAFEPVSVQVIGPLHKASGLGQATRLSFDALQKHFPDCSAYDFDMDNPAPTGFNAKRASSPLRTAKVNLIHLNAESIPLVYAYLPDVFTGAYNIGYFFWELNTPAACHSLALELLDEVWVSSEYGVEQYRPFTSIPITKISMSYEDVVMPDRSAARAYVRSRLGHDDDCFVFFAAFDSFSFIQRKNPQAVVKAFLDAFPDDPKVRLVLKTHNRDFVYDPIQRKIWQMLDEVVHADRRVSIINETLPYEQLLLLKAGCDCYVSLHRSEGWGFGMIEAMHLGVAVLATGYSGNSEFCTPQTAWLVGHELRPIGPGDYIFVTPGQVWAEPDHEDAVRQMRSVAYDVAARQQRVRDAKAYVDARFSPEVVAQRYADRIRSIATLGQLSP